MKILFRNISVLFVCAVYASTFVPTCSNMVLVKLIQGMSQSANPDVADCVDVLTEAISNLDGLSQIECDCYLAISTEEFYDWTGVDASSCSPGSGLSFQEEQSICEGWVPDCSETVMMSLITGMSANPDAVACVQLLVEGIDYLDGLSLTECDCYLTVSTDEFYHWTGVEASTCGPGGGLSFQEEQEMCEIIASTPTPPPTFDSTVPACSGTVLMKLIQGMSQSPNPYLVGCIDLFIGNFSNLDGLSQTECNCLLTVSTTEFYNWTGVDASSCGFGGAESFQEDYDICQSRASNETLPPTSALTPPPTLDDTVPPCSQSVSLKLMQGMSQSTNPDAVACLQYFIQGADYLDGRILTECDCYLTVSAGEFYDWTGEDASTCSLGSGLSVLEEQEICKNTASIPTPLPISDNTVPRCSDTVMMDLIQGMRQSANPVAVDCVDFLLGYTDYLDEFSLTLCDCYLAVSNSEFYDWTGVDTSTCGLGYGLSIEDEQEMCEDTTVRNANATRDTGSDFPWVIVLSVCVGICLLCMVALYITKSSRKRAIGVEPSSPKIGEVQERREGETVTGAETTL